MRARPRPLGRLVVLLLGASLLAGVAIGAHATPTRAASSESMADRLLGWINRDRAERGLVRLRAWGRLDRVALDRAQQMASSDSLSHDAAGGDLGDEYTSSGIHWFAYGEIIGVSNAGWGRAAARHIYRMWKASPPHAAILFSRSFNYLGIGYAYRAGDGTTWASVVFSDSPDHTAPRAHKRGASVRGRDITFHWTGHDRKLQTHQAGLDDFDVEYRVDGGGWRMLDRHRRRTAITLHDRARGHWYGYRVRARDDRGNVSRWTHAGRVWLP